MFRKKRPDPREMQYRDIYEEQQVDRAKIEEPQSMAGYNVATVLIGIAVFAIAWVLLSIYFTASGAVGNQTQPGFVPIPYEQYRDTYFELSYESSSMLDDRYIKIATGEDVYESVVRDEYRVYCNTGVLPSDESDVNAKLSFEQYRDKYYTLHKEAVGILDPQYKRISDGEIVLVSVIYDEYRQYEQTNLLPGETPPPEEPGQENSGSGQSGSTSGGIYWGFTFQKFFLSLMAGAMAAALAYAIFKRLHMAQNALNDRTDINEYYNDQHIQTPEDIQKAYDWFPDVGAHAPIQVSSLISHMALSNKGLKSVFMPKRADQDILDENGEVLYFKGEPLLDEDEELILEKKPIIDEAFMDKLWDASGLPKLNAKGTKTDPHPGRRVRIRYDPTKIPYNPENQNRAKRKDTDTVADLINATWELPVYEPQRPAGAYIVDTEPVNTMILAITRAGKGQTIIEPTLDMWTRETEPNNMVINDPKGELLVKFYVRGTVRGFQIVQFNLINAMKTDIYNPLGIAAEAAREGDFTKCAQYIKNIAEVFFPLDGGDDPVWPNAANNAFQRAAYGLIDYYLEEEKELRLKAEKTGMEAQILENEIDRLWGKVTLYNCYQLFVQLTSKKLKNPSVEFKARSKNGDFDPLKPGENPDMLPSGREPMTDEEYNEAKERVVKLSELWEDKAEADLLTLFFNATNELPRNQMRTLIGNANNALRAMAGAEKMLASVYGIAITAMSFFTDPTISTLTSGTPSQNVDLGGLSFPRRLGVRFNADYIKKYALLGMQVKWDSFNDKNFEEDLGKDFYHEDMISREGWAMYYFKGKYPKDYAYIRLRIINPATGVLVKTLYFEFRKSYQKSLDGRYYITDPVTGEKIVKNGILVELRKGKTASGHARYKQAKTTFLQDKIVDMPANPKKEPVAVPVLVRTMVRYSEKPKMVFLVTPPHLMQYAKLILILITQLVNFNFDKSYMTKSNQKPLYKTRFMLDELGNLQSEGHGIANFQTMLSIGLGQDQQFTIVLQTLQQLRDVYGESVDKIVQGNTSNIVFLKSTDDSMLDTLQKMSGIEHKVKKESKTVTRDVEKIAFQNQGNISYTMSVKEVPVITYNDLAFMPMRNSVIFRAGDAPIWNRNETIMLMSWALFENTITQPGKSYTLQTIPTLSSALEFDVRKNQPDFIRMWEKRRDQSVVSKQAQEMYKQAYDYTDHDIEQMDPDVWADEIMELINKCLAGPEIETSSDDPEELMDYDPMDDPFVDMEYEENTEQIQATQEIQAGYDVQTKKIYAGGMLSKHDLLPNGVPNMAYSGIILDCFKECRAHFFRDAKYFLDQNGSLTSIHGDMFIQKLAGTEEKAYLEEAVEDESARVFAEHKEDIEKLQDYVVQTAFYKFLVSLPDWNDIASGRFEAEMAKRLRDGSPDY